MSITYAKTMPTATNNPSDRGSTFILGRRAFTNNTHSSHQASNVEKNLDYSTVLNKKSSNTYAKPISDKSSSLRVQRLRLSTTGSASMKLKNEADSINYTGYYKATGDVNYINNALSRVRGGGYIAPKKKHQGCSH
jgi:hypothetical protein